MKRFLSMLLALLMLTALPVTALADNDYYESGILVSTPDELRSALVSPSDDILISAYFDWGTGDKTLIIDQNSNGTTDSGREIPMIKLMGSWTIPEDWTVICYEPLYFSSEAFQCTVTVNGSLSFMASGSFSTQSYYGHQMVVNGALVTSPTKQTSLSDFSSLTINGSFENPYRCTLGNVIVNEGASMTIGNTLVAYGLNLPDGIHLTGKQLSMYGGITVNGSAVIDNYIQMFQSASLVGNLDLGTVQIARSTTTDNTVITIPSGSTVKVDYLAYVDGQQIDVGGDLILDGGYYMFDNSILNLDGGTVSLYSGVQFDDSEAGSSVTGTGTVKLYAALRNGSYNDYPRLLGSYCMTDEEVPDCVADTVTIWRNWADCDHAWSGNETVVEPDCSNEGYTLRVCALCGTENKSDFVAPTGKHNLSYAAGEYGQSSMNVSCSVCGVTNRVGIYAESSKVEFGGEPVKIAHIYCDGQLIAQEDLPEIMYINNDKVGTATASAVIGGVTISVDFEIVACIHEEGTSATCQSLAVCAKCGESYGKLGKHVWANRMTVGETTHYYECVTEGCDHTTTAEEMYGLLTPEILEAWEIYRYKNNLTDITILDHVYEDEASELAGACMICGGAGEPGDLNGDDVVDDSDVAQLLWYTLFGDEYAISGSADFTGNGTVDDADVAYLLWFTLFPDDYPLQ